MTRDELAKAGFKELSTFRNPNWVTENVIWPIHSIRVTVKEWDEKGFSRSYAMFTSCLMNGDTDGTIVFHNETGTIKNAIAKVERILGINS